MKLPRWLVIAMLTTSVLLPLAAAGWWWVTWPEIGTEGNKGSEVFVCFVAFCLVPFLSDMVRP